MSVCICARRSELTEIIMDTHPCGPKAIAAGQPAAVRALATDSLCRKLSLAVIQVQALDC